MIGLDQPQISRCWSEADLGNRGCFKPCLRYKCLVVPCGTHIISKSLALISSAWILNICRLSNGPFLNLAWLLHSWAQKVNYLIIIWKYKSILFSLQIWFSPFRLAPRPTTTIPQQFKDSEIKTKFSFALQCDGRNRWCAMLGCSFVHALQQRIFAHINIW